MGVCGRPQDPDVRFCAPMAAAAEARSVPTGVHPGRRVRRRKAWPESLRRAGCGGKDFPLAAGLLAGACDKSRCEAILHACLPSTGRTSSAVIAR